MKAIPSFETSVSNEKAKKGNIQKTGTIDEKGVSFISVAAIYIISIKEEKCHCLNSPTDRNNPKNVRVCVRFVKFIRAVHSCYHN